MRALCGAAALMGGCSLTSLDYLEAGLGSGGAAGTSNSAGATSGSAGAPAAGSAGNGASPSGGALGTAGDAQAGAAGAEPEIPDCNDNRATVDETDLDCGGRTCIPCPAGDRCVTGTDCDSAICTNQVCQPPSCTDLSLNGDETDVNCGGECPPCAQGARCRVDDDCATSSCQDGTCVSATCVEGVLKAGCPLLVDNTPYRLSPSHAPTQCLDDAQLSVAEGTPMILWGCRDELQQTFWAVGQPDGYFALRSALSGKCLQVRDMSHEPGTPVEQSACDYAPDQLWMPAIVDSSLMTLTSKFSGLRLDVAGDEVATDGQAIVQGATTGGADTRWRVAKRTVAAYLTLSPTSQRSVRIGHAESLTTLSDGDESNAHWKVVPGLSDSSMVSFQSRQDPGRYLRHSSFRLWTDTNDGSTLFKRDATFRYARPFVGTEPWTRAVEASNYSGRYWQRDGDTIVLKPYADTPDYLDSATWWISAR